jgi:hypothetical protein
MRVSSSIKDPNVIEKIFTDLCHREVNPKPTPAHNAKTLKAGLPE